MWHGQFELDRFLNEEYIKDQKGGFFVEAGAHNGFNEINCLFFEENLGWNGINIEPVPEIYEELCKNRTNSINICAALYNKNCLKQFTHFFHPELGNNFGNGSLNHDIDHYNSLINIGCKPVLYKVQCNTFKILWDKIFKGKSKPVIDLFVLDVEGGELEALDGILKIGKTFLPKIFCIEHTHCGLDNLNNILDKYYNFSQEYHQNSIYLRNF